jgi:hypothetical protein
LTDRACWRSCSSFSRLYGFDISTAAVSAAPWQCTPADTGVLQLLPPCCCDCCCC